MAETQAQIDQLRRDLSELRDNTNPSMTTHTSRTGGQIAELRD